MRDEQHKTNERRVFELLEGAIRLWVEQDAIHIIAFDRPHLDPVELTPAMARQLADALTKMAEQLDE
jgi:hypothetical protein